MSLSFCEVATVKNPHLLIIVGIAFILGGASDLFYKGYDEWNKQFDEKKRPIRVRRRGILVNIAVYGLILIFDVLLGRKAGRIAFIVLGVLLIILAVAQ